MSFDRSDIESSKYLKTPKNRSEVIKVFGKIKFEPTKNGNVRILNREFRKRIVSVDLPIVGTKWVHELLADRFYTVLQRIEFYQDIHKEEIKQFGTYCPRMIRGSKTGRLSLHSWGIACDVNQRENPMGSPGKLKKDSFIVRTFESEGFKWGGNWKGRREDPMHFQYCL